MLLTVCYILCYACASLYQFIEYFTQFDYVMDTLAVPTLLVGASSSSPRHRRPSSHQYRRSHSATLLSAPLLDKLGVIPPIAHVGRHCPSRGLRVGGLAVQLDQMEQGLNSMSTFLPIPAIR